MNSCAFVLIFTGLMLFSIFNQEVSAVIRRARLWYDALSVSRDTFFAIFVCTVKDLREFLKFKFSKNPIPPNLPVGASEGK